MQRPIPVKALVFFLALWAFAVPAFADEAGLANIVITNDEKNLLIYLTIQNGFPGRLEQAVVGGAPVSFKIYVSLYKDRGLWPDSEIADISATHTLRYDTRKKLYTVIRSEDPAAPVITHSFEEAKRAMSEVSRMRACPLSRLEKGRQYELKAKAVMERVELPLHLRYLLYFVAFWDFETDWYTINFNY
ncbi:MAG: DUF4390 domain-containing protein [Deltaproteobacteria bacterium]|nr:DUF4390 domain-containing protein [Deltaproteobacteria bacterium]